MARPRKDISIEEQITKQEEAVAKAKEKYDSEVAKLKDLHMKRDEAKKKEPAIFLPPYSYDHFILLTVSQLVSETI